MQQVIDFRGAQQCLGRDAAPIQADAAELVALDERALDAELRRPDRRAITAGSTANHDEIEGSVGHHSSIVSGSSTSFLKAPRNCAPTAPSTTRWSADRVQVITVATASWPSRTTGRC